MTEKTADFWMRKAVEAAWPYRGLTAPNPPVGCVLVRDGELLGSGAHTKAGAPHGEIEALRSAGDVRGATAYVTLEPCNHHGKTGPARRLCWPLVFERSSLVSPIRTRLPRVVERSCFATESRWRQACWWRRVSNLWLLFYGSAGPACPTSRSNWPRHWMEELDWPRGRS